VFTREELGNPESDEEARELVVEHMKATLERLCAHIFGTETPTRWVDEYFPFTGMRCVYYLCFLFLHTIVAYVRPNHECNARSVIDAHVPSMFVYVCVCVSVCFYACPYRMHACV
jgi:tRNA synthetases class II core domain (F)